ncbi:hypothetical protein HD554DRAFT_2038968 [Boletus coccyginus]|nr:hypothetical protein HD554DRAFT_2038968 [Boletus coccyginus]
MHPQPLGRPRPLLGNVALPFKLAHGARSAYGGVMVEHRDGWPSTFVTRNTFRVAFGCLGPAVRLHRRRASCSKLHADVCEFACWPDDPKVASSTNSRFRPSLTGRRRRRLVRIAGYARPASGRSVLWTPAFPWVGGLASHRLPADLQRIIQNATPPTSPTPYTRPPSDSPPFLFWGGTMVGRILVTLSRASAHRATRHRFFLLDGDLSEAQAHLLRAMLAMQRVLEHPTCPLVWLESKLRAMVACVAFVRILSALSLGDAGLRRARVSASAKVLWKGKKKKKKGTWPSLGDVHSRRAVVGPSAAALPGRKRRGKKRAPRLGGAPSLRDTRSRRAMVGPSAAVLPRRKRRRTKRSALLASLCRRAMVGPSGMATACVAFGHYTESSSAVDDTRSDPGCNGGPSGPPRAGCHNPHSGVTLQHFAGGEASVTRHPIAWMQRPA